MECKDVLNLVAIIIIPIAAVLIAQWLQNRAEKRKDKMQIFKALMTSRAVGWTNESVNALNVLDIVFVNDKSVRAAWKDLSDKYNILEPDEQEKKKIKLAEHKLLEAIACSLGYKDKITWETIQNPYLPKGMLDQMVSQQLTQKEYLNALVNVNSVVRRQEQKTEE